MNKVEFDVHSFISPNSFQALSKVLTVVVPTATIFLPCVFARLIKSAVSFGI